MIIDTHTHYDDCDYDADRDEIICELKKNNIIAVNAGASMDSARAAFSLARKYNHIYAMAGVHPAETEYLTEDDMNELKEMSHDSKVVAIGEIGLDYHYDDDNTVAKDIQKKWFMRQLELAKELKLPVNIHSRDATQDTLDIMRAEHAEDIGGIIHCYSYGIDMAKEFLKMGFSFGIGGVVTFKNSKKLVEVVTYLPMDKIVLETDCPYLAPTPHRGERNSSLYLPLVIERIAELKNLSAEEVIAATEKNARRVYGKLN